MESKSNKEFSEINLYSYLQEREKNIASRKLSDIQALEEAFNSLIHAFEEKRGELIIKYNQQQIFRACGKIKESLKDEFDLDIHVNELIPLEVIEDEIKSCETKIIALQKLRKEI